MVSAPPTSVNVEWDVDMGPLLDVAAMSGLLCVGSLSRNGGDLRRSLVQPHLTAAR